MDFIILAGLLVLLYPIAHFWGSSRHIGQWWTLALLFPTIIPGLMALLASPRADKIIERKTNHTIIFIGNLLIFIGILSILLLTKDILNNLIKHHSSYPIQIFGLGMFLFIYPSIISGLYLRSLGYGKIINKSPKFYFRPMFNFSSESITSNKKGLYYIIIDEKVKGPYKMDELIEYSLKEDTLVCKNGEKDWIKASQLMELKDFIIYAPPPLPKSKLIIESSPISNSKKSSIKTINKKGDFMQLKKPSKALAAIIGTTPLPRTEIVKILWAYVKKNGLQDPNNKRMIDADEKLKKVFNGKSQVSMFEMTKLVNKHLS